MFNVLDELKEIQKFSEMDLEEMKEYISNLMQDTKDYDLYACMYGVLKAKIDYLISYAEAYKHYEKLAQHYNQEGNNDGE